MSDRRLKEAFDNIHADEQMKRHTQEFLARKTGGYRRGSAVPYWRMAAAMACLLFVLFGSGGWFLFFIPVSSISVDVNPSVELGVNRFDRVVTVETYNDDGQDIMSSLNVRFMDYRDALDKILDLESREAYLAEDSCIAITVSGAAEGKQREMLACLHTCASSYGNVHCSSGSHGEAEAAHAAGMTLGRYQAFLELQALDPSVTTEDIEGLTMNQIWDWIGELGGNTDNSVQGGNAAHHGTGHGCGGHHGTAGSDSGAAQENTGLSDGDSVQDEADTENGTAQRNAADTENGTAQQDTAGTQNGTAQQDTAGTQNGTAVQNGGGCGQNGHHGGHGH